MKTRRSAFLLIAIAIFVALPVAAEAQLLAASEEPVSLVESPVPAQVDLTYTRPTQETKIRNYAFDTFGPYPLVVAAAEAGIGQADHSPKEWQLGAAGYGMRFGSDFGIAAISTTTRYALAEALKEDTLYYRCECKSFFPRLGHAVVSTLTARHGEDGHRAFSFSALAAPYVGSMTAVYGWYPGNYGAGYAFRLGSYNLLGAVGQNILLEFFYSGPHSLRSRMHLDSRHAAPDLEAGR